MTTTFVQRFNRGFFAGVTAASQVPHPYPVAIGGHPYLLDDSRFTYSQYGTNTEESVPDLRPNIASADEVGEHTLNPMAGWRRSQASWHKGAGQRHYDASTSDRERFWASKNVYVWTKWELSLLPGTASVRASANTNLALATSGSYTYVADGTEVFSTPDLITWTAVAVNVAEGAQTVHSICSDGYTLYSALGVNGIHQTVKGATVTTHYNALAATLVRWTKGRLMAAAGDAIYTVTASGAAPTALFTHPNSDFVWVDFCEGDTTIYAAGYSGDKSELYRIGIITTGSGLDQPIHAGHLPDGEIVTALYSYLGYVLIGTNKGVRVASPQSSGDLVTGPLIQTPGGVYGFDGQDRFVWFSWGNLDTTSTGVGRMDLSLFNADVPAYATDLMASAQGAVSSLARQGGRLLFAVAGVGVYQEGTTAASTGFLDTGLIGFDLVDDKVALSISTRTDTPMSGTYRLYLAGDDGVFVDLGLVPASGIAAANQTRAESYEIRHELTPTAGVGPVLHRWTLIAPPAPRPTTMFTVPILLTSRQMLDNGQEVSCDVEAEQEFLRALRQTREVTTFQEGTSTWSVQVMDYKSYKRKMTDDSAHREVTMIVQLVTVNTQ